MCAFAPVDSQSLSLSSSDSSLLAALRERVVVADGAMGTMLQAHDLGLDDFEGHEGCNEILNVTRPDVVRQIHDAYFDDRLRRRRDQHLRRQPAPTSPSTASPTGSTSSRVAGARLAREVADGWSTAGPARAGCSARSAPAPSCRRSGTRPTPTLRDAYEAEVTGLIEGGADAVLVETAQDLLQAKAAINGARRAFRATGRKLPLIAQVTVETTGTMLLGSEIGAALTALEPLEIDLIGLNCATGPAEMSEHLRYLSRHARIGLSCMPNAGLPELTSDGARYPLTPEQLADAHDQFTREFGLALVGGCCGTTPDHIRAVVDRVGGREVKARKPRPEPGAASLYQHVPFRQDITYLSVGERTNTNGSKAFREAMLEGRWDDCVEIAREQVRDGAHVLDVCVDYVGRDGADRHARGRRPARDRVDVAADDRLHRVAGHRGRAGVPRRPQHRQLGALRGRQRPREQLRQEDARRPRARRSRRRHVHRRGGPGPHRRATRCAIASRIIDDLVNDWGIAVEDIFVDCLTFTLATGTGGVAARRPRDGRGHPRAQAALPDGADDARRVQRLVRSQPGRAAGAQLGVPARVRRRPASTRRSCTRRRSCRCRGSRTSSAKSRSTSSTTAARDGYDPLQSFLQLFEGVTAQSSKESRAEELAALPLSERLKRRIIDGERNGLEPDLDEALQTRPALEIINDTLLEGMKVVGELFGSGQMQLPFVLQSAEVMKAAVGYLEPHMEKADEGGKGTIVLATVKGDVHDIGKNLVDIILSNNGYNVVNLGIKQPITTILEAADEHRADAIGMSGLLVKSTVIMKENLEEMNSRGVGDKWPVLLGRRGTHPRLRRGRPRGHVLRRGPLRPRRVRRPAADGRGDGGQARRARRGAARAARPPSHDALPHRRRAGRAAGALRRRRRQRDPDTAVLR